MFQNMKINNMRIEYFVETIYKPKEIKSVATNPTEVMKASLHVGDMHSQID